jgi:hypothetical protein
MATMFLAACVVSMQQCSCTMTASRDWFPRIILSTMMPRGWSRNITTLSRKIVHVQKGRQTHHPQGRAGNPCGDFYRYHHHVSALSRSGCVDDLQDKDRNMKPKRFHWCVIGWVDSEPSVALCLNASQLQFYFPQGGRSASVETLDSSSQVLAVLDQPHFPALPEKYRAIRLKEPA